MPLGGGKGDDGADEGEGGDTKYGSRVLCLEPLINLLAPLAQ